MGSSNASSERRQEEAQAEQRNLDLRLVLNNAYGFVRGQQTVQSFSALTYEELAFKQNKRLTAASTESRFNEFDRLDRMQSELVALVEAVKAVDPSEFLQRENSLDVNTDPEPEEA